MTNINGKDILNTEALLSSFIWIEPLDSDTFFKVKETLTRIRACE